MWFCTSWDFGTYNSLYAITLPSPDPGVKTHLEGEVSPKVHILLTCKRLICSLRDSLQMSLPGSSLHLYSYRRSSGDAHSLAESVPPIVFLACCLASGSRVSQDVAYGQD